LSEGSFSSTGDPSVQLAPYQPPPNVHVRLAPTEASSASIWAVEIPAENSTDARPEATVILCVTPEIVVAPMVSV